MGKAGEKKKEEQVKYYLSPAGFPYAILGNRIANYIGSVEEKELFRVQTIEQFNSRRKFRIRDLRDVADLPFRYKKGLIDALSKAED